jgi:hypothetical protein
MSPFDLQASAPGRLGNQHECIEMGLNSDLVPHHLVRATAGMLGLGGG